MRTSVKNFRTIGAKLLLLIPLTFISLQSASGQQTSIQSLKLKNERSVQTELKMNAGVLHLNTHSGPVADLKFVYSKESWKPEVNLERGRLQIIQPNEKNLNMKDPDRNEWDVTLPRSMEGDLEIRLGAGEAILDLQDAKFNRLSMEAGAGNFEVNLAGSAVADLNISAGVGSLSLDLSGLRTSDLIATINGGIGDVDLSLPAEAGVRIKVNGLGSVDHPGLTKRDGYYVNDLYGKTNYSVEITVNGGLGSVQLALK